MVPVEDALKQQDATASEAVPSCAIPVDELGPALPLSGGVEPVADDVPDFSEVEPEAAEVIETPPKMVPRAHEYPDGRTRCIHCRQVRWQIEEDPAAHSCVLVPETFLFDGVGDGEAQGEAP